MKGYRASGSGSPQQYPLRGGVPGQIEELPEKLTIHPDDLIVFEEEVSGVKKVTSASAILPGGLLGPNSVVFDGFVQGDFGKSFLDTETGTAMRVDTFREVFSRNTNTPTQTVLFHEPTLTSATTSLPFHAAADIEIVGVTLDINGANTGGMDVAASFIDGSTSTTIATTPTILTTTSAGTAIRQFGELSTRITIPAGTLLLVVLDFPVVATLNHKQVTLLMRWKT